MAHLRDIYAGLTVLMNYDNPKEDPHIICERGWSWVDGPVPGDLEDADLEELHELGWGWNTIREKWMFWNDEAVPDCLGDCVPECFDEDCPAHPVNDEDGEVEEEDNLVQLDDIDMDSLGIPEDSPLRGED